MSPYLVFVPLGAIVCSLVSIPAATAASKVIPPRIDQLAETSERIILATVESVQSGLARAAVKEVWKGPEVETVEYSILPCCLHDISKAIPGETVLLFLTNKEGGWRIVWHGRGRMKLEIQDSKDYVSYFYKENFPAGTPSVAFSGREEGRGDRGVELNLVKELVIGKKERAPRCECLRGIK